MNPSVDDLQRIAASTAGTLSLAGGLPMASLFPRDLLEHASVEATRDHSGTALQYGWPEGSDGLRRWIAGELARRGADVSSQDVIVTSGAQQAISLAVGVLPETHRTICVEPETYPGALDVFRRAGPLTTDPGSATARYVISGVDNPTGIDRASAERERLLAGDQYLLIDEAYAELRFDGHVGRPLLADAPERVFHIGTVSKTLFPGLRVGWIVAPAPFRQALLAAKRDADLQAPTLGQDLLERLLERLDWQEHLAQSRRAYARLLERLMSAVRRHLSEFAFREPEGGFALYVTSDDPSLDELRILERATALGTSFDPGRLFRHDEADHPFAMRLSPCNVPEASLDVAVERIAHAVKVTERRAPGHHRRSAGAATP